MLLFTTSEKLESQSICRRKNSQIEFRGKILTRGPDFAMKSLQTAKQYCQIYYHSDSLCILVNNSSYVSVWKEYNRNSQVKSKQKQESAPEPEQSIPIKLNPELLSRYQQKLTEYIGPIASVICAYALAENPEPEVKQFIKAIAQQIPDKDRAKELERRLLDSF